jgi:hypothetical protein
MKFKFCSFCENELQDDNIYCRFCRNSTDQKLKHRFSEELKKYRKIVGAYGKITLRSGVISMSNKFGLMGQNVVEVYAQPNIVNKHEGWLVIGQEIS